MAVLYDARACDLRPVTQDRLGDSRAAHALGSVRFTTHVAGALWLLFSLQAGLRQ